MPKSATDKQLTFQMQNSIDCQPDLSIFARKPTVLLTTKLSFCFQFYFEDSLSPRHLHYVLVVCIVYRTQDKQYLHQSRKINIFLNFSNFRRRLSLFHDSFLLHSLHNLTLLVILNFFHNIGLVGHLTYGWASVRFQIQMKTTNFTIALHYLSTLFCPA